MKTITHVAGFAGQESEASRSVCLPEAYPVRTTVTEAGVSRQEQVSSVGRAVRIVGVLAFGQSLLFLALWLLICSWAGAATTKPADFSPELTLSTYEPTARRSPLTKTETVAVSAGKQESTVPVNLQLEGILYEASHPAAVVNVQVLLLNKLVTINTGGGELKVRALEITRTRVVIDVGGRQMQLRLSPQLPQDRQ
jgi:hypothetical protein